jgi:hypothetical protein
VLIDEKVRICAGRDNVDRLVNEDELRLKDPFSDCLLNASKSGLLSAGTCRGLTIDVGAAELGKFQFCRA